MIKKIFFLMMTLAVVVSSCNNYETYGDKKDKERNAISKFIYLSLSLTVRLPLLVRNSSKIKERLLTCRRMNT